MMPRRDGLALLAGAARRRAATARVPVLLLSARAGQEAAVEGLAAQADDYLVKPFTAPELLARVGAHLQLGRARRRGRGPLHRDGRPRAGDDLGGRPRRRRVFRNAGLAPLHRPRPSADELGDGWQRGAAPRRPASATGTVTAEADGGRATAGRSSTGCGAPTASTTGWWSRPSPLPRRGRAVGVGRQLHRRQRRATARPSASALLARVGAGARRGSPRSSTGSSAWRACSSTVRLADARRRASGRRRGPARRRAGSPAHRRRRRGARRGREAAVGRLEVVDGAAAGPLARRRRAVRRGGRRRCTSR